MVTMCICMGDVHVCYIRQSLYCVCIRFFYEQISWRSGVSNRIFLRWPLFCFLFAGLLASDSHPHVKSWEGKLEKGGRGQEERKGQVNCV